MFVSEAFGDEPQNIGMPIPIPLKIQTEITEILGKFKARVPLARSSGTANKRGATS